MTSTRLVSVALLARESGRSKRFYREAFGIQFEPEELTGPDNARLRLSLFSAEASVGNAEIELAVDDLDSAHARATAAGAKVVQKPEGGAATYLDPDGNLVTLRQRPLAVRVAGVDLARGGLAVVVLEENRVVEAFRCESFAEALLVDAQVVAVDIPIGIPEPDARPADLAARRFVGPRGSSVFTTPIRRVLEAETYADARALATELTGKSISAQTYALRRRMLELDQYAHDDERVIEVHPEVSFRELAHRPLISKHRTDGLVERRALLEEAGIDLPPTVPRIAEPDLLDATVAAWSARRYALGEAESLPAGHPARIGAIWR